MDRLIHSVPPKTPSIDHGHIKSRVILDILVDVEGNVECAKAVEGHPIAIKSAIDAVPKWKFRPYVLAGKPEPVLGVLIVTYDFDTERK